jgi:hypothetical protein
MFQSIEKNLAASQVFFVVYNLRMLLTLYYLQVRKPITQCSSTSI